MGRVGSWEGGETDDRLVCTGSGDLEEILALAILDIVLLLIL